MTMTPRQEEEEEEQQRRRQRRQQRPHRQQRQPRLNKNTIVLTLTLTMLVLSTTTTTTTRTEACEFTFFPHQVRTPDGVHQVASLLEGKVSTQLVRDVVSQNAAYTFEFKARLKDPINPRLCRYLVVRNDRSDLYFPSDDLKRKPLSKDYHMPEVRCMLNSEDSGPPVGQYPQFGRGGSLANPNSLSAAQPLCGHPFYFERYQLLRWTGTIPHGVIRILECQSGLPKDASDWVMVPLWQANCTGEVKWPGYPPVPPQ
eukprot:TRINITY_DN65758_c0_g1_i1.p1 TRINITY_DN65758_c0_g1~~TRINITY_DN65758_c0_g1_i1.p1  ORF type:complete len:265 (-),score=89.97 TRINITY_DN65758_c0_g1_i1:159-929(-)